MKVSRAMVISAEDFYALIETLNGNYVLKQFDKIKDTDSVEQEFYGTLDEVKKQSRKHINELKKG
tara:strand:- start:1290 stop:1484 length:195 start_codon:yes stop_codon:yes gene_type:complete